MTFRFLHAADLHLDAPFDGLAARDPELRQRLLEASAEALDALVALAIREQVLFVALAGDLHDGAVHGLRGQVRLHAALSRLDDAGIHTFIVHGNHDPVDEGWSAIRSWPDRVHVFPAGRAETVELRAADGGRVTVSGTSFPLRHVQESLLPLFGRPKGEGFHVGILHAHVGSDTVHSPYNPCSLDALAQSGHDAWLLGHIHARQVLRTQAPFIAYAGTLQGRSFKPSEQGPKGALLCEVSRGRIVCQEVDLAPVRFHDVSLDCTGIDDLAEVMEQLRETAADLPADGRMLLLRATLTGHTPLFHRLQGEEADNEAASDLLHTLQEGPEADRQWTAFRLRLQPEADRAALREQGDIVGELVRTSDTLGANLEQLVKLLRAHKATRPLVASLGEDDLDTVLSQATDLALHLLDPSRRG